MVASSACAVGSPGKVRTSGTPPRKLGATPAADATLPTTTTVVPAAPTSAGVRSPVATDAAPSASAPPDVLRAIAAIDDPQNDVGTATPPYGDVVRLAVEGGSRSARFTVTLAGAAPNRLAQGETVGIGIDLGRPGAKEGAYQLFADGGARGWVAYLYTPRGFVRYPGTFAVDGSRVAFRVPWSSIGGLRDGSMSVFCDWSKRGLALGMESEDSAPDKGRSDYRS